MATKDDLKFLKATKAKAQAAGARMEKQRRATFDLLEGMAAIDRLIDRLSRPKSARRRG